MKWHGSSVRRLSVLAALSAICSFVAAVPAHAALLPANGDLIVSKKLSTGMENVRELFRVDLDATTPDVRLTFRDGRDIGGTFSPDGNRFAWNFYPDNSYLFYGDDIWVMDPDEPTTMANLTGSIDPFDNHWESTPDWSPDGSQLAIETADHYPVWPVSIDTGISVYDFDSNAMTDIVSDADPSVAVSMGHPSWSPDGKTIAYSRGVLGDEMSSDIYLYDVASGTSTRIPLDGGQLGPDWSPDGQRIVVQTKAATTASWDVATIDAATGAMTPLVTSVYDDTNPAWSPDGLKIAYVSPKADSTTDPMHSEVYALDVATGSEVRLTDDAYSDAYPV